jgi:lysophospholipase L1-like esterase
MRVLSPLIASLVACSLSAWSSVSAADAGLKEGDLVAICGDSITEQKDYSVDIEDYLLMCQPTANLQAVQFGWGGETASGFLSRMANDALRFHPTVATTCYGMNDGGYAPLSPDRAKQYHDCQLGIVQGFKKAGVRFIVVGSPGCVDSQTFRHDPDAAVMYNKTLAELGQIAHTIATDEGVAFADVHDVMMEAMAKSKAALGKDYQFAGGDGVHPGRNGHLAMAYAYLKALGCDGAIGTISMDLTANTAEGSAGHKILSCAHGEVQIQSTRYPFCFSGDANQPTTRSAINYLPFNQDLNRLTLVVTHAGAEQVSVTWGTVSKAFSAAALAKGINLAAEFPDNPFVPFFNDVESHVRGQQIYETPLVKNYIHNLAQYIEMIPAEKATWTHLADLGVEQAQTLRTAAVHAVVPVTHHIVVSAVK